MMLDGAQIPIPCSKIGWQTVQCSWSIDGEAALTNSSPGTRDQQSPRRRGTQYLAEVNLPSEIQDGVLNILHASSFMVIY